MLWKDNKAHMNLTSEVYIVQFSAYKARYAQNNTIHSNNIYICNMHAYTLLYCFNCIRYLDLDNKRDYLKKIITIT